MTTQETAYIEIERLVKSFKDTLSENTKEKITKLIENIRQEAQNENFNQLKVKVEELKMVMKEIVEAKMNNESNSDPMSNLNDL